MPDISRAQRITEYLCTFTFALVVLGIILHNNPLVVTGLITWFCTLAGIVWFERHRKR